MKQLFCIIFSIVFLNGCSQPSNNNEHVIAYKYSSKMKKTYFANYDFRGDFEIVFNGISLKKSSRGGVISGIEYLNPFIVKSGIQSISLVVKPLDPSHKIKPEDVKSFFMDIVYTENGASAPVHNVKKCTFSPIQKPEDSLMQTWTLEADVPYELEGFANCQDLTEDTSKLLSEVVEYYQHIRQLINDGNAEEYLRLYKKSREREMITMYYDAKQQREYLQSIRERIHSSKGFMKSLDSYQLLIHPNGKLVELIAPDGGSPMYSINDKGKRKRYGLQLYRSAGTGKLEVY